MSFRGQTDSENRQRRSSDSSKGSPSDSSTHIMLKIIAPDGKSYQEIPILPGSRIATTANTDQYVQIDEDRLQVEDSSHSTSSSLPIQNPRRSRNASASNSYVDQYIETLEDRSNISNTPLITSSDSDNEDKIAGFTKHSLHEQQEVLPPSRKNTKKSRKKQKKSEGADDLLIQMDDFISDTSSNEDTDHPSNNNSYIQERTEENLALAVGAALRTKITQEEIDSDSDHSSEQDGLVSDNVADYISISMTGVMPSLPVSKLDRALQWADQSLFTKTVVKPFISIAKYSTENWHWLLLGVITAIPGAINAFCNPANIDPKNLIEALKTMPFDTLMKCLWSMWCNLSLNSAMNSEFFRKLSEDFQQVKRVWESGASGKIAIICAFATGFSAALAAGSIGYSAFLFLPAGEVTALLPAALNASITFISRFNGLLKLITRVNGALAQSHNQDNKLKDAAVNQLDRLTVDTRTYLNEFLRNQPVDEQAAGQLFTEMEKLIDRKKLYPAITQWLLNTSTKTLRDLKEADFNGLSETLKVEIDRLIREQNKTELADFTGNKIPADMLIQFSKLHAALSGWLNRHYPTASWAQLAHESDETDFQAIQQQLCVFLNRFTKENNINLKGLFNLQEKNIDTNNIDKLVRDIQLFPTLKAKTVAALITDIKLLSYLEILKHEKNIKMASLAENRDANAPFTEQEYNTASEQLADHLNQVAEECDIDVELLLPSENITGKNIDALLKLIDLITDDKINISNDPSAAERFAKIGQWIWLGGKIGFSAMGAYAIAEIFDYKGFQGINLLVKQVSDLIAKIFGTEKGISLDHLVDWQKILTGICPALATSLFYFIHIFDGLDSILEKFLTRLKENPDEILLAAVTLVHTYYSGGGMRNIAANIAKTNNNFIGLDANNIIGQFKVEFNGALASIVNTKIITGMLATPAQTAAPVQQQVYKKNVDGVATYLEKITTLPASLSNAWRKNSLFKSAQSDNDRQSSLRDSAIVHGPGIV